MKRNELKMTCHISLSVEAYREGQREGLSSKSRGGKVKDSSQNYGPGFWVKHGEPDKIETADLVMKKLSGWDG